MQLDALHIYKSDFKFSAAHFLIFDKDRAERLHGHNYRVRLQLDFPPVQKDGFHIDFASVKKTVRQLTAELDEHVILPKDNEEVICEIENETMHVRFRDRVYAFPKNEVILLPIVNSSVEELSRWFCQQVLQQLTSLPISSIAVEVEETEGQSARFEKIRV